MGMTALALLPVALFALTACSSNSPPPVGSAVEIYEKGVPGQMIVQTVQVTATVTAMDQVHRQATLQGADGKEFTVQVGRKATGFAHVRVGDRVTATLTQKIALSLDDNAASAEVDPAAVVARAPKGGQPGSLVAETIQARGKIVAIDLEQREITLQFEDGSTETIRARPDLDLSRRKLGDQFVFRVTEMTLLGVEKTR